LKNNILEGVLSEDQFFQNFFILILMLEELAKMFSLT